MRKLAFLLSVIVVGTVSLPASANWSPVDSTEGGFHQIIVEDSVPFFRTFSFLHSNVGGKEFVCESMNARDCDLRAAYFNVILPVCKSAAQTDCIEALALTPTGSPKVSGEFERYSMPNHPSLFKGDGRRLSANPQSPSIWNVPGVEHEGGLTYAVHAGFTGGFNNGRITELDFYAQVYAFKEVTGRGEEFDQNGFSNFSYCDFKPSNRELTGCGGGANPEGVICVIQIQAGGTCGAKQRFPENTSISLTLRLAKEPNGWYHGRLSEPSLGLTKNQSGVSLVVTGDPVEVPILYHSASYKEMPNALKSFWDECAKNGRLCPWSTRFFRANVAQQRGEDRNMTSEQKPWTPRALQTVKFFQNYTRGVSPTGDKVWAVRSLEQSNTGGSPCYARAGFKGLVSTNATAYSDGPPSLTGGVLKYSLAAPSRYQDSVDEISGKYDLVMSRSFANCIYGAREVSPRASVGVSSFNGNKRVATSVTSKTKQWIRLTARAFSF